MTRYPRTQAVLECLRTAELLRQAAAELDQLATEAPALEIGALSRRVRAIGGQAVHDLEGDQL